MSNEPEVFGLYTGKPDKILRWTQDPTEIGQWVLDSKDNAAIRLTPDEYFRKFVQGEGFDGSYNLFDILDSILTVAQENDDQEFVRRLCHLTPDDLIRYDHLVDDLRDSFAVYLRSSLTSTDSTTEEN